MTPSRVYACGEFVIASLGIAWAVAGWCSDIVSFVVCGATVALFAGSLGFALWRGKP